MEGSGIIEFEEFVKFILRLNNREGDKEEEARYAFRRLGRGRVEDIIHDGFQV